MRAGGCGVRGCGVGLRGAFERANREGEADEGTCAELVATWQSEGVCWLPQKVRARSGRKACNHWGFCEQGGSEHVLWQNWILNLATKGALREVLEVPVFQGIKTRFWRERIFCGNGSAIFALGQVIWTLWGVGGMDDEDRMGSKGIALRRTSECWERSHKKGSSTYPSARRVCVGLFEVIIRAKSCV